MREYQAMLEHALDLHRQDDLHGAAEIYDKLLGYADKLDPYLSIGYAALLDKAGNPGLSVHLLRQVVAQLPDYGGAWTNLGTSLTAIGRYEAAELAYDKAVELQPEDSIALAMASGFFVNRARADKVVDLGRRAVALAPDLPEARNHLALGLLEQGKFEEAWPHYEYRWKLADKIDKARPYQAPRWNGEKVKTLAIHGEQGVGDEILFMSLFNKARHHAERIVIECQPRLVPIFAHSFGVPCYGTHDELISAEGEPDAYVPMGSLPLHLGLPDGKPFLKCNVAHGPNRIKRIGIAWRGGTGKTNKAERGAPLKLWAPILKTQGVEFVSVQYGDEVVDNECKEYRLPRLFTGRGVVETFNAVAQCDLVITVCQAAVHVAGSLGIPCWVLTPKKCAWRYTGETERMLWYNSVRLFRQDDTESWEPVVERIAREL